MCGFEAELETKLLIGEVKEKQEARQEYNAAIARGETAACALSLIHRRLFFVSAELVLFARAVLEQDKRDIFRQKVGNIPPRSRVNIRITYVADLKVEADGAIRFVLPTAVAPRYSPNVEYYAFPVAHPWYHYCGRRVWYGDYERWRYVPYWQLPFYRYRWIPVHVVQQQQKPCAFSVTVEVETASDIARLECPSHELKYEFADAASRRSAVASLWQSTEPLGKDFVLRVHQVSLLQLLEEVLRCVLTILHTAGKGA